MTVKQTSPGSFTFVSNLGGKNN